MKSEVASNTAFSAIFISIFEVILKGDNRYIPSGKNTIPIPFSSFSLLLEQSSRAFEKAISSYVIPSPTAP